MSMNSQSTISARANAPAPVYFERRELDTILNIYGRMVAAGEWRDYAINMHKDRAVFSIFKRAAEMPIYRVDKQPSLARKQGAYSIVSAEGVILKRGQDLASVLKFFDRRRFQVV